MVHDKQDALAPTEAFMNQENAYKSHIVCSCMVILSNIDFLQAKMSHLLCL